MPEPMNGGDGKYSYNKNSKFQGVGFEISRTLIETSISKNLDVKNIVTTKTSSNTFSLVDLGCASGPNTFAAMQSLITSISQKYHAQMNSDSLTTGSRPLEFQVFFNDLPTNDFNTLVATLPSPRSYFAAAAPGSFLGRLFPASSLHFAYACYAMHWLSKIPDECLDRNSKAWNKGRIHFTGGCEAVEEAHAAQFGRDLDRFLEARAEEVVSGGMVVLICIGCPDDMPQSCLPNSLLFEFMGSALLDMAKRVS
uniref:S-adenosylmethionine-dependent methyltransferase n=1 Tax=Kalanchoe fedtschenkoi TaxID=63787 RepID=A0A7N0TC90_KALFE